MNWWVKNKQKQRAFTIVELLIVIVVIAILASIVVVAYNGVSNRAARSSAQTAVSQAARKVVNYFSENNSYPVELSDTGVIDSDLTVFDYVVDNSASPKTYCVQSTVRNATYYIGYSDENETWTQTPTEGFCRDAWISTAKVTSISAGYRYYCVISDTQDVYCTGSNGYGQLGDGTTVNKSTLVPVNTSGVLAGKKIKDMAVGGDMGYGTEHACALAFDNQVYCWGSNSGGALGNGDTANTFSSVPVAVDNSGVLAGKTIKDLKVGYTHNCVLASDDLVYCWGGRTTSLNDGQLGNGANTQSHVPVAVNMTGVLSGKTIKQLAVGTKGTCVIASDDQAYCWGNTNILGASTSGNNHSPLPIKVNTSGVLSGKALRKIMMVGSTACVMDSDSLVYCWGSGNIGNGTTSASEFPAAVTMNGVAAKKFFTTPANNYGQTLCFNDADKKIYCWSKTGQNNDEAMPKWDIPTEITAPANLTVERFSASGETFKIAYGIASDGNLYRWRDLLTPPTLVPLPW